MTKFLTAVLLFLCLAFAQADNIRVVMRNLRPSTGAAFANLLGRVRVALKNAKTRISTMKVAFVVEEDDTAQRLLEVLAPVELRARHDSFRTT